MEVLHRRKVGSIGKLYALVIEFSVLEHIITAEGKGGILGSLPPVRIEVSSTKVGIAIAEDRNHISSITRWRGSGRGCRLGKGSNLHRLSILSGCRASSFDFYGDGVSTYCCINVRYGTTYIAWDGLFISLLSKIDIEGNAISSRSGNVHFLGDRSVVSDLHLQVSRCIKGDFKGLYQLCLLAREALSDDLHVVLAFSIGMRSCLTYLHSGRGGSTITKIDLVEDSPCSSGHDGYLTWIVLFYLEGSDYVLRGNIVAEQVRIAEIVFARYERKT